ncbi:hypothetical protein H8356DRAFT_1326998 [Neocallimastix lanati (nom. inval.)]|nr:hypothetical protein H8356DRAFT_1326998 [Neocallimastix sp. JGI-2020a]
MRWYHLQLVFTDRKTIFSSCDIESFKDVTSSVPSFSHWIFSCKVLENYRNKILAFLDDLFLKFTMIIEQKSLDVSEDPPMKWTVFPGVLITAFCDSDDNQWLSFLKWLLVRREKSGILEDCRK